VSHYIYLVRHGEQQDAEFGLPDGPLSAKGKLQAAAIGERLARVPFTAAWHSPLQRATETARIIESKLDGVAIQPNALLFDCYPSGPSPELPHAFEPFFGGVSEDEIEAGKAQMADATSEFLAPARGDRHDLLITHNFVIGWFVREVLDAPEWRWLGINQENCGLTVIRVRSAKPPVLVTHNDIGHLPLELRTSLTADQPY
jgi:probable phosphoglycerate mutase